MEEEHFVDSSLARKVLDDLNTLRLDGLNTDLIIIRVAGTEVPAHRVVLSSFSPMFKAMFSSGLAESDQDVIPLHTQEAAVMKIPFPMAIFFFQKVVRDTLKMVPN